MNIGIKGPKRLMTRFATIIFLGVSLCVALSAYVHPQYNWDMVPYIASAFSIIFHNPEIVHSNTYEIIKTTIPQHFNDLARLSTNYQLFQQQLPFYTVKPLYIGMVFLLWQLGFNIVHATVFVSVISYWLISLTTLLSLRKMKAHAVLYFTATLFIATPPFFELAGLSTPDALSVAIIVLAIYFMFVASIKFLGEVFLVLSVLARPDNVIFVGLLLLYLVFSSRREWKGGKILLVVSAILSGIEYFLIEHFSHTYGYSVLFENTFVHVLNSPATYTGHVTVKIYATALAKGVIDLGKDTMACPLGLTTIATIFMSRSTCSSSTMHQFKGIIIISFAAFAVHFALFPSPDDRFFAPEYAVIMVCLLHIINSFNRFGFGPKNEHMTDLSDTKPVATG